MLWSVEPGQGDEEILHVWGQNERPHAHALEESRVQRRDLVFGDCGHARLAVLCVSERFSVRP